MQTVLDFVALPHDSCHRLVVSVHESHFDQTGLESRTEICSHDGRPAIDAQDVLQLRAAHFPRQHRDQAFNMFRGMYGLMYGLMYGTLWGVLIYMVVVQ